MISKDIAITKFAHWFREVEETGFKSYKTILKTFNQHYNDILNYFNHRSTNASAESFNAKIKNFRMQLRGVKDGVQRRNSNLCRMVYKYSSPRKSDSKFS